ncbi:hypothetical protein BSL78_25349 [Apostichopus japonicus]|uniref:Uncharacterized protein n=1 Tax=Stichopus japonicus TaxID=307972 RepID=A0A2G8JPY2_STIJA|nr:hypothetical protein BSL78_25349 [Apostichopus japonicus]
MCLLGLSTSVVPADPRSTAHRSPLLRHLNKRLQRNHPNLLQPMSPLQSPPIIPPPPHPASPVPPTSKPNPLRELPIEGQLQHSQNAPFHLQHSHSDPQAVIVPHPLTSQSQQPSQTVTSCEVKSIPVVAGGFQQSQHAPAVPDQPGQWSESEQTASDTPPEILSSDVHPSQHASPYFPHSPEMSEQDQSSQHTSALPMPRVELSHHASEHKQPIQQAYCEADIPVEFALTQNRPSQHASHLNQTTLPLLAQGHASPSQNAPEFYRSSVHLSLRPGQEQLTYSSKMRITVK